MTSEPYITYFNMGSWPLYFGVTQSKKAFSKECKRISDADSPFLADISASASVHFFDAADGTLTAIMTMGSVKKRSPEQVASLVAHEAVHVVQRLWASIGEKRPGWESEAYLVQYIVQCCLQHILKTGRVNKISP